MALWHLSWISLPILAYITLVLAVIAVLSLYIFTASQNSSVPKYRLKNTPTHVLVVLGSGGHTAEMFAMLRRMQLNPSVYTYRTYVVSTGDNFSASSAVEFERSLSGREQAREKRERSQAAGGDTPNSYSIVTVPRARRVHQSSLTAPISTVQCLWACLRVLRGVHPDQDPSVRLRFGYPDIILTNGPATAVCAVLAARILRFLHYLAAYSPFGSPSAARSKAGKRERIKPDFQLRTIFVESWARVTTLSLSGMLLLPLVDRFLVQWPGLEGKKLWKGSREAEYVGALVD